VRTQKRQKVFYWDAVDHERLFRDAWEREARREREGGLGLAELDDATVETARVWHRTRPLLVTFVTFIIDFVERALNAVEGVSSPSLLSPFMTTTATAAAAAATAATTATPTPMASSSAAAIANAASSAAANAAAGTPASASVHHYAGNTSGNASDWWSAAGLPTIDMMQPPLSAGLRASATFPCSTPTTVTAVFTAPHHNQQQQQQHQHQHQGNMLPPAADLLAWYEPPATSTLPPLVSADQARLMEELEAFLTPPTPPVASTSGTDTTAAATPQPIPVPSAATTAAEGSRLRSSSAIGDLIHAESSSANSSYHSSFQRPTPPNAHWAVHKRPHSSSDDGGHDGVVDVGLGGHEAAFTVASPPPPPSSSEHDAAVKRMRLDYF
jgi:hypothetical protein